jgi:hypothetical protein
MEDSKKSSKSIYLQPAEIEELVQTGSVTVTVLVGTEEEMAARFGTINSFLWVREDWQITDEMNPFGDKGYIYRASDNGRLWESTSEEWLWKSGAEMPITAARLFVTVASMINAPVVDD